MGKRRRGGRNNRGKIDSKYKPILVPFESKFTQNAISTDDAENYQENEENDVVGNFEQDSNDVVGNYEKDPNDVVGNYEQDPNVVVGNFKQDPEEQQVEAVRFDNADEIHNLFEDIERVCAFLEQIEYKGKEAVTLEDLEQVFHILQEHAQQMQEARINGLTRERIKKFEHFSADESLVGEQCVVCLEDLEVGTQMARLDCHVSHCTCKTCTDVWFKDHKKCPLCNHVFN